MNPGSLRLIAAVFLVLAIFLPQHAAGASDWPGGLTPRPAVANADADGGLVRGGSFETGLAGWSSFHGLLERVSPGRTDNFSARTTWVDPGAGAKDRNVLTIDNYPGNAPSPMVGDVYTATAWVRTDVTSTALGKVVFLALREHNREQLNPTATDTHIVYSRGITLTTNWQQAMVTKTIVLTGMTNVDVYVQLNNAATGNSFYADDFFMAGPVRLWLPSVLNNLLTTGW